MNKKGSILWTIIWIMIFFAIIFFIIYYNYPASEENKAKIANNPNINNSTNSSNEPDEISVIENNISLNSSP